MQGDLTQEACVLIGRALGDWWKDDRRNWCAYCGIKMRSKRPQVPAKGTRLAATTSTKDHVISRQHGGGLITIPACRSCNAKKGGASLQEFLLTDYFRDRRRHRHRNQWPEDRLWLVASLAALKRSIEFSNSATVK